MLPGSIPHREAATGLAAQARIALPVRENLKKALRQITTAVHTPSTQKT
jgi:hypothetical protein